MKRPRHEHAPCHGDETPWFDGHIKPGQVGLYQRRTEMLRTRLWVWAHWNGKFWGLWGVTPERAMELKDTASEYQHLPWRGLDHKPTQADACIHRP